LTHTIRTRFAVSLAATILRSGISFATGLLLARLMGPEDYGRMAFLLASFMAFRQLLDMASSSAFFTFLSQRPRSRSFVNFYWRWIGLQFLIPLLLVGFLLPENWMSSIWEGEERSLVLLAFVAAFMQNVVWSNASQMAEAQRETIQVQHLNILVVVIHLGVVLMLWWLGHLAIPLLFVALALEWSLAGWFAARLYRGHDDLDETGKEPVDTLTSVWREFWRYCLPFVPYAWLGFAHNFADRWMLQHWGGAAEQAYYAVASQFSAVALLATTSILRIFWKEIAEAHHRQDVDRVHRLYLKVSRGLYFVGAMIVGGLLPWTSEIIQRTLGASYAGGEATLMLMLIYTVHQSMGQIGGTMLYATDNGRIQVMVGIGYMTSSLVVAYLLMAPGNAIIPGLALASRGLAWKMLVLQLVQVNIMAWFIARIFGWRFDWSFQIVGLGLAIAAGWLAKAMVVSFLVAPWWVMILAMVPVYLLMLAAVLYLMPWLGGLKRADMLQAISALRARFLSP